MWADVLSREQDERGGESKAIGQLLLTCRLHRATQLCNIGCWLTVCCHSAVQDVYGGKGGAIAQLCQLEKWFQRQREFFFYRWVAFLLGVGDLHCQGCPRKL